MYVNFKLRKEVKIMEYKTPQLTALTSAIKAVQDFVGKDGNISPDSQHIDDDVVGAYQDWE
jgi:hypothetical protein